MPAPSPEEQLPFLLDEDPSRGSSKHSNMNSQAGSSVNAQMGLSQQQQYQQQQAVQPSLQQQQQEQERQGLAQQRRAWSMDPQQALQVGSLQVFLVPVHPQQKLGDRWESGHVQCIPSAWV